MGLAGSRWAAVRPKDEEIAKANSPEARIKTTAELIAVCATVNTQDERYAKVRAAARGNPDGDGRFDPKAFRRESDEILAELARAAAEAMAANARVDCAPVTPPESCQSDSPSADLNTFPQSEAVPFMSAFTQITPDVTKSVQVAVGGSEKHQSHSTLQATSGNIKLDAPQSQAFAVCALGTGSEKTHSQTSAKAAGGLGLATNFAQWNL